MKKVALLVGGGINPDIAPAVQRVVAAAGASIDWERHDVVPNGNPVTERLEEAAEAVRRVGVALKTRLPAAVGAGEAAANLNVALRRSLGLYAGVRPIKTLPGLPTRYPNLDVIIVRENSEDVYKGIEHEIIPGVVESLKVVTEAASERIARFAFETARHFERKHITFVHKANIMKRSDGLFMRTVRRVAEEHPDLGYREMIVDAVCMQMVLDPYQFDVMLMGNLYGDVLSSLGNGLTGGIASGFGIDIGDDCRVYEAIHGDAPQLVGKGVADPLPLLTPAVALLHYLDEAAAAVRIEAAVEQVLTEGTSLTPDLGGTATTREMTDALIAALD